MTSSFSRKLNCFFFLQPRIADDVKNEGTKQTAEVEMVVEV